MVYMQRIGLFWTRENRSRVLVPWDGVALVLLGGHQPSSCRLHMYILNGGQTTVDLGTGQAQDRLWCNTHAPCGQYVSTCYLPTYSHTLAEGAGGVRGEGRRPEETVDRADFDGASRGEVRIEWLTLCPPADPMDLKPMDAV